MKIKLPWVVDPKNHKMSVALTNLLISITFLLVAGSLQLAGVIKDTGLALEYFGISSALYFGRKLKFGDKDYSAEDEEEKDLTEPKP